MPAARKKSTSSIVKDLRERIARACRVLGSLDLTIAGQGHVSARIPGRNTMLIRARGPGERGVRYTTDKEVIEIDFDGKVQPGARAGIASPAEIFIHAEIYKRRPEVHSVVHIHPPTVVLLTICDTPLLPIFGAYDPPSLKLALDGVPRFDRSVLINTPALGQDLFATMGNAPVCLMRGHGITTAGNSIEEAALYCVNVNELATMNYRARLLGDPRPITKEDQAALMGIVQRAPTVEPGVPPPFVAAAWRYYCTLTKS